MNPSTRTLKEIADCNLRDKNAESPIRLPDIQRGLVWRPRQIELLWDSLLCGYPIGVLMIIGNELFDGQQRVNAIIKGFDIKGVSEVNVPDSILWLDLDFERTESRYYGFRMTTKSHPWGFPANGGTYLTKERRESMRLAGIDDSMSKGKWDIRRFRPYKSTCAIPFAIITDMLYQTETLQIAEDSKRDIFAGGVVERFGKFVSVYPNAEIPDMYHIEQRCRELYGDLSNLLQYKILECNIDIAKDDLQKLELFFNRINTGGTPITQEELAYSAIKLYWKGNDIARINSRIAASCMSEERFAQIVFRTYCSKENIRGDISAMDIRKLREGYESEDGDAESKEIVKSILEAYDNDGTILAALQEQIDCWLIGDTLPSYIRTEIAYKEPSLYILLFTLARLRYENGSRVELSDEYVRAMALYVYCCSEKKNRDKAIHYLYKKICGRIGQNQLVDEPFVGKLLCDCIIDGLTEMPHPNINDFIGFRSESLGKEWDIYKYYDEPYGHSICRMFNYDRKGQQMMLLKIAEREAFKTFFPDYNPARRDLWDEMNRPWDDDHIIPKDWISYCDKDWRLFCQKMIWSMGNFAHIPFEKNREKSNKNDWEFYEENDHAVLLHFDPGIKELTAESLSNEMMIRNMASLIIDRFSKLYEAFVAILNPLGLGLALNQYLVMRKQIMCQLRDKLFVNAKFYYVADDSKGKEINFEITDNFGWMQQWIAVGVKNEEKDGLDCVAIGYYPDDDVYYVETGIRKNPDKDFSNMESKEYYVECAKDDCREFKMAGIEDLSKVQKEIIDWVIEESFWSKNSE